MTLVHPKLKSWQCTCDTSPSFSVIIYLLSPLPISCCSLPVSLWLSLLSAVLWKLFMKANTKPIVYLPHFWCISTHTYIPTVRQIVPVKSVPDSLSRFLENQETKILGNAPLHGNYYIFKITPLTAGTKTL